MKIEILYGIISSISSSYDHILNLFRKEAEPEKYSIIIKNVR